MKQNRNPTTNPVSHQLPNFQNVKNTSRFSRLYVAINFAHFCPDPVHPGKPLPVPCFQCQQAGLQTGNQDSISSRVSALTRTVLGKSMAHTKTHQLLWDYWYEAVHMQGKGDVWNLKGLKLFLYRYMINLYTYITSKFTFVLVVKKWKHSSKHSETWGS